MTDVVCSRDGLALDGKPFYLLAGQVHYFRFPRAEWRSILNSARAGGLNTIDTVIPWNFHEPSEGQYDFSDMADLAAYIDLCAELGLKFIARPGPYICAEWENGGLPAWLAAKAGIAYRLDNAAYREATERWFDVLIPLLADRQADRGGPIILVQVENEHWASGVYGHDDHQETLATMLRARGIRVPLYTCMGAMPAADGRPAIPEFRNGWTGIDRKLAETRACWPDNPLIVSELWSGWFDNWGASRHNGKSPAALDARLHELTAAGASGFSHWMWAGGTNFGFWGGRTVGGDTVHMTTSYDYDAPIDEFGGLTEKFFVARRHHLFLATLGAGLAPRLAAARPGGPHVIAAQAVAGRAGGGGEVLANVQHADLSATFLRNTTSDRQTYQVFLPAAGSETAGKHLAVDVEAMSIKPILGKLPLAASGLTLRYHSGRLLGFWSQAGRDVFIVYGYPGEQAELALAQRPTPRAMAGPAWQVLDAGPTTVKAGQDLLELTYWVREQPTVVQVSRRVARSQRPLTLVILTQAYAERCWPLANGEFLIGPDRVDSDPAQPGGGVSGQGCRPFYRLDTQNSLHEVNSPTHTHLTSTPPAPGPWTTYAVSELGATENWLDAGNPPAPPQHTLGYTWYRTQIDLTDSRLTLAAPDVNDRGHLFVDGRYAGTLGVGPGGPQLTLSPHLAPGRHELHLLLDNLGRFNYGGSLGEIKGLNGPLYPNGVQTDITQGWVALWQEAAFAGEALASAKPAFVRADADHVDLSRFPFSGPEVWLLREIDIPAGQRAWLYLTGDRNPGSLFVNGRAVMRFSRHFGGGYIKHEITDLLAVDGPNVIALNIRNYAGLAWRAWLVTADTQPLVTDAWSFKAGVTPAAAAAGPETLRPAFWRSRFSYNAQAHGPGPFKLSLGGLRKGQLWLNGRNLGRYWQIGPQEFYKLPVSWLAAENELLVFEEEAGVPDGVRIWAVAR